MAVLAISHVAIGVTDMERFIAFYCDVIPKKGLSGLGGT